MKKFKKGYKKKMKSLNNNVNSNWEDRRGAQACGNAPLGQPWEGRWAQAYVGMHHAAHPVHSWRLAWPKPVSESHYMDVWQLPWPKPWSRTHYYAWSVATGVA